LNNNTKQRLCTIDGCNNKHAAKGYCFKHYQRVRFHGDPHTLLINRGNKFIKCKIEGCEKRARTNGMCPMHVSRVFRHGDPHKVKRVKNRRKCIIPSCNKEPYVRKSEKVNRVEKYCYDHLYTNEEHKERNHRRRAMKKNALINDLTKADIKESFNHFNNSCGYCGNKSNLQVEHVVPLYLGGSHTKTNIIPACSSCNTSKQETTFEEWYSKQPFYSQEQEAKIYKWLGYEINNNKIQMMLF